MRTPRNVDDAQFLASLSPIAREVLSEFDALIWSKFYEERGTYWKIAEEVGCAVRTVGRSLLRSRPLVEAAYRQEQEAGQVRFADVLSRGSQAWEIEDRTEKAACCRLDRWLRRKQTKQRESESPDTDRDRRFTLPVLMAA